MLFIDKKVDDTTAGIIKRIINGLVIPPVKKISPTNCKRSYDKYKEELKLLKSFSFTLSCKKILVKVPKIIIEKQKKYGKLKSKIK